MDKLEVAQVGDDVIVKFHPDWVGCVGELITYIPKVRMGQIVNKGQVLASMETGRCISTITAPVKGKVTFIERNVVDVNDGKVLFLFKERE